MFKITKIVIILLTIQYSFILYGSNENLNFTMGLNLNRTFGYTQYQIGGFVTLADGQSGTMQDPLSELIFPTEFFVAQLNLNLELSSYYNFKLNLGTNIDKGIGKMKDSDFGIWWMDKAGYDWAYSTSLDIYSESDTDVRFYDIAGEVSLRVYNKGNLWVNSGIGMRYQYFNYVVSNLEQSYPSYSKYSAYLDEKYSSIIYIFGEVLKYKVEYFIPYITFETGYDFSEISFASIAIKLSPWVYARDIDDHILRYKESTSLSTGFSFMVDLAGFYYLDSEVYLKFSLSYLIIYTNGEQSQRFYQDTIEDGEAISAGPIGVIENNLMSSQFSITIGAGYKIF